MGHASTVLFFPAKISYLSPLRAGDYAQALNSFYQMTIEEKQREGTEEEVEAIAILFSEALGRYFEGNPIVEAVAKAP